VRGTTTILRIFKANTPQFVYQNRGPIDLRASGLRAPRGGDSRRLHPLAAALRAKSGALGNPAFTMPAKSGRSKLGSCRKGSQTLMPLATELSVHLSRL